MAVEKNIVIGADLSGLEQKLDELIEALKASQKQADKTATSINDIADTTKDIGKSAEDSKKGVKGLSTGFKGLGVAIKAAGIGLLLEGFRILKDLFDNNQKVVDAFSTSFNFLAGIFSEVSAVLEDVYNNVAQSSENFDALGRVLKNILTIAIVPVQLAFQGIKSAMLGAQLAWEQSWLGGNDPQRIEELKGQLEETRLKVVEIGEGALAAGKGIANDIGEAIQEVSKIGTEVVNGLKKIDAGAVLDNARAMTKLNKEAEIAEVLAQGLIEKYDLQAEKLRQVRDDERLSVDERIKANEDLGKVLEEQEKVMLDNAKITLAKARQELALAPKNIEFIKAKMAAENELAGVQAQVTGFRSEQLMNEMSLQRELLDIQNARSETEQEINELQSQVAIEQATTMRKRLDLEEELSKKSFELQNQRLMNQLNTMEVGSTAYEETINALDLLDGERFQTQQEEARKRIALEQAVQDSKVQMSQDAIGALNGLIQAFAGENEKAQKRAFMVNKAAGIANAVISTSQAVAKALAETTDPTPTQSLRFANAALAAATGVAQVATIARQQFNGGGSVDTNIDAPTSPSTSPQFNIVGSTGQNAILESLQRNPVKAYVVGSDVTSQQELDRNRINQVSFP